MDFNIDNLDEVDTVSFYIRNDFNDNFKDTMNFCSLEQEKIIVTHYIERNDIFSLIYYIKKYMDTSVENKHPDTPKNLIFNKIPKDFIPKY